MQIRQQAFRYQLIPSREQQRKMRQFAGSARYAFNRALAFQNQRREKTGRKQSVYAALCKLLTPWRNDPETAWPASARRTRPNRRPAIWRQAGRGVSKA